MRKMHNPFNERCDTQFSWFVMLFVILCMIALSAIYNDARSDIGIKYGAAQDNDGGQMVQMFATLDVGPQGLGWYIARTYQGTDDANILVGIDYSLKPFNGPVRLAIGPSYSKDRLRLEGQHLNFHLMAGLDLTKNIGLYIDHWSNCRTICNHDKEITDNPPRNVVSVGVKF